jgi:hypothetical protein
MLFVASGGLGLASGLAEDRQTTLQLLSATVADGSFWHGIDGAHGAWSGAGRPFPRTGHDGHISAQTPMLPSASFAIERDSSRRPPRGDTEKIFFQRLLLACIDADARSLRRAQLALNPNFERLSKPH